MLKQHVSEEDVTRFGEVLHALTAEAAGLQEEGVLPESKKGQDFAAKFWMTLMELTGGDVSKVQMINEQMTKSATDEKHDEALEKSRQFMASSLRIYFLKDGLIAEAAELHENGVPPDSEQGQDFADRFWTWVMELTGGDLTKVQEMNAQFERSASAGGHDEVIEKASQYIAEHLRGTAAAAAVQLDSGFPKEERAAGCASRLMRLRWQGGMRQGDVG